MGLSLGALGIVASSRPILFALRDPAAFDKVLRLVEPRSFYLACLFVVVTLILAYLTNPSEASFRTYLTELSFRRHLSRLYDAHDSDESDHDCETNGLHTPQPQLTKHPLKSASEQSLTTTIHISSSSTGFHFANRASVSLRSPGHVFRSLGICTIAAVPIVTDASSTSFNGTLTPSASEKAAEGTLAGSWFIGIFGKWFVGGTLQLRQQDNTQLPEKDDPFSAGVLSIRSLDREGFSEGLKSIGEALTSVANKARKSPSQIRGRRTSRKSLNGSAATRTGTPPPLPKSASLPLHATHGPPNGSPETIRVARNIPSAPSHPLLSSGDHHPSPPLPLHNSISILDQSPIIVDILKQVTVSQGEVTESHNQLATFQSASDSTRHLLQSSLDSQRARKREEDALRLDLKARNRGLEDSKRQAEAAKRESEKRLKHVQISRDRAANRIERLSKEISDLQSQMAADRVRVTESTAWSATAETELRKALEDKRVELKVAEDVVSALALRARELEEQIEEEKGALARATEEAETRRRNAPPKPDPLHINHYRGSNVPTSTTSSSFRLSGSPSPVRASPVPLYQRRQIAQGAEPDPLVLLPSPYSTEHSNAGPPIAEPRPRTLPLQDPSDSYVSLSSHAENIIKPLSPIGPRGSKMSNGSNALTQRQSHFSPFGDAGSGPLSPFATSLIPSSLFTSTESIDMGQGSASSLTDFDFSSLPLAPGRSLPDVQDNQRWQAPATRESLVRQPWDDAGEVLYTSPTSTSFLSQPLPPSSTLDHIVYPTTGPPTFALSANEQDLRAGGDVKDVKPASNSLRKWFASSSLMNTTPTQSKSNSSGLNPDAKVFSFTRGRSFLFPSSNNGSAGLPPPGGLHPSSSSARDRSGRDRGSIGSTYGHAASASTSSSLSLFSGTPASPASTGSTSTATSFLSSLMAFTPSPAEREALQRALGHSSMNRSVDHLSDHSSPNLAHPLAASPFTSPLPSARSSAVDVTTQGMKGLHNSSSSWDLYLGSSATPNSNSNMINESGHAKRPSFSSLWNRSKAGTTPYGMGVNGNVEA